MTEIDSVYKTVFVFSGRGQCGKVSQTPGAALDLSLTTVPLCLECVLCPEKARKPVIVENIRDLPFKVAIHPRQMGDPKITPKGWCLTWALPYLVSLSKLST